MDSSGRLGTIAGRLTVEVLSTYSELKLFLLGMTEDHQRHGLVYKRSEAGDRFQDDRARFNRARQAAEALFAPKQPSAPAVPALTPLGDREVRKPRILKAAPTPRAHGDLTAAQDTTQDQPRANKVPTAHWGRIRAWLKYGMTIPQIAQVYGVAVGDIERILQIA